MRYTLEWMRRHCDEVLAFALCPALILLTMFGGEYGPLAALIILYAVLAAAITAVVVLLVRALRARRYREILEQALFFGVLGALVLAPMHIADTRYGISPLLTLLPLTGVGMLAAHVLVRLGLIRPTSPGASSPHASS